MTRPARDSMNARATDASNGAARTRTGSTKPPAQTAADKRAEADRRFAEARQRFLSVESNRKLLIELAKR